MDEYGHQDNLKESDSSDKYIPLAYKIKAIASQNIHSEDQDRRKKFLTDGTNIQGLWAMPGRR